MSNPSDLFTPFLPTTFNVPRGEIQTAEFITEQFCNFADVINDKKIGNYLQESETLNGEKWWYDTTKKVRNGYQAIARITSYPNAGTLTLDLTTSPRYPIENVNPQFVVSHVWGSASKPCSATGANDGDYFSFMNQGDSRISFTMSDTEIIITTTIDLTAYSGFIIIEYIRDGV